MSNSVHPHGKQQCSAYQIELVVFTKILKTKIMATSRITWCQIDGEAMETETDFIFLGPQITADGDCSHEIKIAPWK